MKHLLVILVLLAGILVPAYWYYTRHVVPGSSETGLTVEEVEGSVWKARGDESAELLSAGLKLPDGSVVWTGDDGRVLLSLPEGGQVDLGKNSKLAVRHITDEGVSIELRDGRIKATVMQFHKRRVDVSFPGNPATVRITNGTATAVTDGKGAFDLGTLEGDGVSIIRPGQPPERVPAGMRRSVRRDGEVAISGKIPSSVLLKVNWPEELLLRQDSLTVTGSVAPGSLVRVDGVAVEPGADGAFEAIVPLKDGRNRIAVEAIGLGEPSREESPELILDRSPPRIEAATDEIWK